MGTVNLNETVRYDNISEIMEYSSYTVQRTSGEIESGWSTDHSFLGSIFHHNRAHYDTTKQEWRIYMNNGKKDDSLFAWRRLDTTYPTILTGDQIDAWRKVVKLQLQALDQERLKRVT